MISKIQESKDHRKILDTYNPDLYTIHVTISIQ